MEVLLALRYGERVNQAGYQERGREAMRARSS